MTMQNLASRIDKIIGYLLVVTLVITPLFFLPFTQDFYDSNKWMLFVAAGLLMLILWTIRTVATHTVVVSPDKTVAGFGALFVASVISIILASPNKAEALVAPYGPTLYAVLAIFFFIGAIGSSEKIKKLLRRLWYAVLAILSIIAIYQFFGVGKTMFPNIAFLTNELWTPVGSTLSLVAVFILTLPLLIDDLGMAVKKKEDITMALLFSVVLIVLAGMVVSVGKLIPVASDTVLSIRDGWAMTLEVLKDPKRALFGVGLENFLYAFTTGRPPELNQGPQWNIRFTTNASVFLHTTATLGAIGLVAMVIFMRSLLPKLQINGSNFSKAFALVSLFLVPPTITLFTVYVVILLLTETDHGKKTSLTLPPNLRYISGILSVIVVIVVIASVYGLGKVYAAELVFYKSLVALQNNDGMSTYNLQIKSASLAPNISRYHLAYSQTNLAIANAIATNAQSAAEGQPVTLSDQDRQTISSLIQQSIREAKIAVNLAPENVAAWENLAGLYQSLINVVADVDQWAIATYQRAIQLDPTNPNLRLGLGGVFLLRQDAENAIQQFSGAISLKPDWANAHYNLAYAYKLRKDYLRAAYSFQQTLNYLPQASSDRATVENELAEARKQLTPAQIALLEGRQPTAEETQAGSQLTLPDEEPLPVITPKIELPADSSPPAEADQASQEAVEGEQTEAPSPTPTSPESPQLGPEEVNPTVQPQQ